MIKNKAMKKILELCKKALENVEIEIHSWEKDADTNEKDPYLVPGAICEVWWDKAPKEKKLMYFRRYDAGNLLGFSVYKIPDNYDIDYYDKVNYRVIDTPWDHAPEQI